MDTLRLLVIVQCLVGLPQAEGHAQSWSLRFTDQPCTVTDCLERDNGKLVVLRQPGNYWSAQVPDNVLLTLVDPGGSVQETIELVDPTGLVRGPNLEALGPEGAFAVIGSIDVDLPPIDSARAQAALWVVNDQLNYGPAMLNGPALIGQNLNSACRMPDGRIAAVGWVNTTMDGLPSMGINTYLWSAEGEAMVACVAYSGQTGWFEPNNIHPWPNGGVIIASNSPWAQGPGMSINVLQDDLCTGLFESSTVPFAFGPWNVPLHYLNQTSALPFQGSRIITAGTYDARTPGNRCGIQVMDSTGVLVRQQTFDSAFPEDLAALYGNLDTVGPAYFFAQMDNSVLLGHPNLAGRSNRVHVRRLDTLLNTEAEFVIDGTLDDTQYTVLRLRTARSGGVYVFGEAISANGPLDQNEGWIAYIAPQDFQTTITEHTLIPLQVWPDPGTTEVQLRWSDAVPAYHVRIIDLQGRKILEERVIGGAHVLATHQLAAGTYIIQLMDRRGELLARAKWSKQ